MLAAIEWLKNWQSSPNEHRNLLRHLEVFMNDVILFCQASDGIFVESVAKGLLSLDEAFELNNDLCELLQIMSRHPAPNCRKFLLSMIPIFLVESWRLGWFEKSSIDSMLEVIDQTLLICYEQDLKIRPTPSIRVCAPNKPSIYSSAIKTTSNEFPFNVRETRIDLPSFNVKIKQVNDYNRLMLTARFCQTIQDVITELPSHTRQTYFDLLLSKRILPPDDEVCLLWLKAAYFMESPAKEKLLNGISVLAHNELLPKTILALQQ